MRHAWKGFPGFPPKKEEITISHRKSEITEIPLLQGGGC